MAAKHISAGAVSFLNLKLINQKGLGVFSVEEQKELNGFFGVLARFGIFVVPGGELESWLPALHTGKKIKKRDWVPTLFEKMGSDPSSEDYVTPSSGDVWDFMKNIIAWITAPARLGMPG